MPMTDSESTGSGFGRLQQLLSDVSSELTSVQGRFSRTGTVDQCTNAVVVSNGTGEIMHVNTPRLFGKRSQSFECRQPSSTSSCLIVPVA